MLNFHQSIEPVVELLLLYGFHLSNSKENLVEYVSDSAVISIGYDARENSIYVLVGNSIKDQIPLDANNLEDVFGFNLKQFYIDKNSVDYLTHFLTNQGKSILNGKVPMQALVEHRKQSAARYTAELLIEQNIKAAENAWAIKNYCEYMKCFEKIRAELPTSYKLKYDIAKKKCKKP